MRGRKYSFFTLSAIREADTVRSCQCTFHKISSTRKIDPGINYHRKHKQEQVLRVNLASVSSLKEAPGLDERKSCFSQFIKEAPVLDEHA